MEDVFLECIKEERQRGRTVLLSSHLLSEVEALCDRVSIIRSGQTVKTGTLAELRNLGRTSIEAELARPPDDLSRLPGIHDLRIDGTHVRAEVDNGDLDGTVRYLASLGVRSLTSQPPTLDELFLEQYRNGSTVVDASAGQPAEVSQ